MIYRLSAIEGIECGSLWTTPCIRPAARRGGRRLHRRLRRHYETSQWIFSMTGEVVGMNVPFAEAIKGVVTVPVVAIGRLGNHPEVANEIIREGKADLVNFGRSLLADPDLPMKLKEGRPEDIRPCLGCGECSEHQDRLLRVACAVNPQLGHEWETRVKGDKAKRVVVVGAGPAGMEAACVAAERGHQVTCSSEPATSVARSSRPGRLGSRSICPSWSVLPHPPQEGRRRSAAELPGDEADPGQLQPDVVIVAAGATEARPPIPGIGSSNCFMALEVLAGNTEEVGQTVVIVGGGEVGLETALFLAHDGRRAIVLEMLGYVGGDVNSQYGAYLTRLLDEYGVEVHTNHQVKEITPQGVW